MNSSKRITQQNLLATAIRIAAEVHESQTDRGGNAYVLHPLRLMFRLRTSDAELMQIAVLHDALEDSADQEFPITIDFLRSVGFSERVLAALELLTHDPNDPYDVYILRVASNRDATRIKLEDLRDNSDITRLKGVRTKDIERIEKYHKAYILLSKVMQAYETTTTS